MKNKLIKGSLMLALILVAIGGAYIGTKEAKSNNSKGKTELVDNKGASDTKEETAAAEFSKEGALDAATKMLKELQKSPDESMSLEDRMTEVSSKKGYESSTIFTDEGWEFIHLEDFMATDPRGKTLAAQSLLSVIHSIELVGNQDLEPADIDIEGVVYLDKKLRTAFVPLDLYTNTPTNLSLEMGYIDGKWVLQPYTLIAQIAIRTMDDSVIAETPEAKGASSSAKENKEKESSSDNPSDDKKKEETKKEDK